MQGALHRWINRTWYAGGPGARALQPAAALYGGLLALRRRLYDAGLLRRLRIAAPVVVIGNLTAGGTGKTPVAIWLAQALAARGYRPGIVSRGYGGAHRGAPMRVDAASDPARVGDEPVLLARRSGVPVCVDAQRVRAADMLVAEGVNVVIADDGLQHWALARDFEICVVDASRGFGNGRLLPAGPLREPLERLDSVDLVLVNGGPIRRDSSAGEVPRASELPASVSQADFHLAASTVCRLDGAEERLLADFAGSTVHAVAAIGNPQRFFQQLRDAGLNVIEHAFPDHAPLAMTDLSFADEFAILMTEKDAVKIGAGAGARYWYVPVDLAMEREQEEEVLAEIEARLWPAAGSV